jgi:hypothetical protein
VLLAREELAGWLGSFDRYAGKKGADESFWLSTHGGKPVINDRKSGEARTIYVPSASVSVTGTIQPRVLSKALGTSHRESGLLARLLLTMPPRPKKEWNETEILEDDQQKLLAVFNRLYGLDFVWDGNGIPRPVLLSLTKAAKKAWVAFYGEHAHEEAQLDGDEAAAWSKLEGYAARLALVVHLIRWAAEEPKSAGPRPVDKVSIAAGVVLANWFGNEARRVYAVLRESDEQRDHRRLREWIEGRGGHVTVNALMHGPRAYRSKPAVAETALEGLVRAGYGAWVSTEPGPEGGRPTREFRLVTRSVNETSDPGPTDDKKEGGPITPVAA